MQVRTFLVLFFILIVGTIVIAVEIGEDGRGVIIEVPPEPINYSIRNVNSSDYWDDLDTPGDISVSELNDDVGILTSIPNQHDQDLNTTNSPTFVNITVENVHATSNITIGDDLEGVQGWGICGNATDVFLTWNLTYAREQGWC